MQPLFFVLSLLFTQLHTTESRLDGLDGAVFVEIHAVDADFAMYTGTFVALDVILVDAVIYDVPLVGVGNLEHTVVGGTVDFTLVVGTQNDGLLGHFDRTEGRLGGSVSHMVVGRTGVVN